MEHLAVKKDAQERKVLVLLKAMFEIRECWEDSSKYST